MLGSVLLAVLLRLRLTPLCHPRLTLGLMGLDALHLRVLAASSDEPKERKDAQKGVCLRDDVWLHGLTLCSPTSTVVWKALGPCGMSIL